MIAVAIRRNKQRRERLRLATVDDIATQQTTDVFHNPMFVTQGTGDAIDNGEDGSVDDFAAVDDSLGEFHTHRRSTQRRDNNVATMPNAVYTTPPSEDATHTDSKVRRTSTQRKTGIESTMQNTVYVSSDMGGRGGGGGAQQPDDCLYAIPSESSGGTSDPYYATILDPATGLPYEVPLDPPQGCRTRHHSTTPGGTKC